MWKKPLLSNTTNVIGLDRIKASFRHFLQQGCELIISRCSGGVGLGRARAPVAPGGVPHCLGYRRASSALRGSPETIHQGFPTPPPTLRLWHPIYQLWATHCLPRAHFNYFNKQNRQITQNGPHQPRARNKVNFIKQL